MPDHGPKCSRGHAEVVVVLQWTAALGIQVPSDHIFEHGGCYGQVR